MRHRILRHTVHTCIRWITNYKITNWLRRNENLQASRWATVSSFYLSRWYCTLEPLRDDVRITVLTNNTRLMILTRIHTGHEGVDESVPELSNGMCGCVEVKSLETAVGHIPCTLMKSSHIMRISKALLSKLSPPQVEKVCGSQAAGHMMPSAYPTTSHAATSVSPAASVTNSDRSPAASLPSAGLAAHQRPQQQSRRWVTYCTSDEIKDKEVLLTAQKNLLMFPCSCVILYLFNPPGHSFLKGREEIRVAAWKNCQGKFTSISWALSCYQRVK